MHPSILYELGLVLFFGFFAALIMRFLNQSVIIGYMVTGLLIGPNVLGLIKDTALINHLSELGIVFLMFFLGLEFSLKKFKMVKNPVLFIGTSEIIANLIVGLIVGSLFGLFFKERLFFACIVTLSSSGVVAKVLFDLKRTASRESDVLMGVMIYEDFIAVLLLGVLSSVAVFNAVQANIIASSLGKSLLFYVVFIVLGLFFIDKFIDKTLMRIHSQEMFTALMLGMILLTGALAAKIGLASAAGAFLLGMIINSYDVEERIHRTIAAFKDIFLIVFFISFGMLLDPKQIPGILWMVAIMVPISILVEVSSTSTTAFLCGFSAKSAAAIGSSMIARGEYALICASLGLSLGAISDSLYQFTGVYSFIMTSLAPLVMKNSNFVKNTISNLLPSFMKFSIKLVAATVAPILFSERQGLKVKRRFVFTGVFFLYILIVITAFIVSNLIVLVPLCLAGFLVVYELRKLFIMRIKKAEKIFNFHQVHQGPYNLDRVARSIANIFSGLLAIIVLGASFWNFGHIVLYALLLLFIAYLFGISLYVYKTGK